MKAVVSTTHDDKYLFFLPIITWCWNRLGVGVICVMPSGFKEEQKRILIASAIQSNGMDLSYHYFKCAEHKEATYAQCSRLYAAAIDLPSEEILVTSDIDMALFQVPPHGSDFTIFGADLTPPNQYPICYIAADVKTWRQYFIKGRTLQQCLDDLLGSVEVENMRGNYWGKDQETAYKTINELIRLELPRARPGTQFATKRYDRDDAYILDRLSPDGIDFHMPRPGYEEKNFEIILKVLEYHYPYSNFEWLKQYRESYVKLL